MTKEELNNLKVGQKVIDHSQSSMVWIVEKEIPYPSYMPTEYRTFLIVQQRQNGLQWHLGYHNYVNWTKAEETIDLI